jgi:hypothetical protein
LCVDGDDDRADHHEDPADGGLQIHPEWRQHASRERVDTML